MILRTDQGRAIANVFDILKTPFLRVDIEFNNDGCKILSLDASTTLVAHLLLHKDSLGFYETDQVYKFSIITKNLATALKQLKDNDILEFKINPTRKDELIICFYAADNFGRPKKITSLPIGSPTTAADKAISSPPDFVFGCDIGVPTKHFETCTKIEKFNENFLISFGKYNPGDSSKHYFSGGQSTKDNNGDSNHSDYYFSVTMCGHDGSSEIIEPMHDLTVDHDGNVSPNPPSIKIFKKTGEFVSNYFPKDYIDAIAKGNHISDTIRIESGISQSDFEIYEEQMRNHDGADPSPEKPTSHMFIKFTYDVREMGVLSIYLLCAGDQEH